MSRLRRGCLGPRRGNSNGRLTRRGAVHVAHPLHLRHLRRVLIAEAAHGRQEDRSAQASLQARAPLLFLQRLVPLPHQIASALRPRRTPHRPGRHRPHTLPHGRRWRPGSSHRSRPRRLWSPPNGRAGVRWDTSVRRRRQARRSCLLYCRRRQHGSGASR